MKRVFIIVALIATVFGMFYGFYYGMTVLAADPFLTSQSLYYADFPAGGSIIIEEYIHNVSSKEQTITTSAWCDDGNWYAYPPSSDQKWMEESWISNIVPSEIILPSGNKVLVNITLTLPDGVADGVYIGWLKVSDGTVDKPVTLVVRVGTAIPTYAFHITKGSYYRLFVDGMPAFIDVNEGDQFNPIEIKSTSSAKTLYQATVSLFGDRTISSDSAVKHEPSEVGMVFKEVPIEESSQWLTMYVRNSTPDGPVVAKCTQDDPIILDPFATGTIFWKLEIPNSVEDGNYVIHVRVSPAVKVQGTNINCDYAIPFLIRIERAPAAAFVWKMWYTAIAAVGICSIGIVTMVVLERRKQNT